MTYRGTFRRGVVVLEGDVRLADGTAVEVRLLTGTARKGAGGAKAMNNSRGSQQPAKSTRRRATAPRESSVDRAAREQGVTGVPFDELLGGWPQGEEQDGFEDAVDRWRAEEPRRGEF